MPHYLSKARITTAMTRKIMIFFLITSLCASVSGAADMLTYHGPAVTVRYPSALRGAATALVRSYPGVRSDLETKLGWKTDFIPLIILIRRNPEFGKLIGAENELVTAFAVPGQNLIVMDYSKLGKNPFDVDATLEHELCHLLLHRHVHSPPRWLDEGVAQWASGGMADIINPGHKDILKQMSLAKRLIPLQDLSAYFPGEPRGFFLAYEESKSFVEYVAHEYGAEKLRAALHRMEKGETADQALTNTVGINLDALQEKWRGYLRRRYSWPSYLANNLFWILFFSAALVTLIGYIQAKRRLKNYRDEDDEFPGYGIHPDDRDDKME